MFPPDPYGQFGQQPSPDTTEPPSYHDPGAGGAPLPLPYDDYDPTYQDTPPRQPPVYQGQQPSTFPEALPTSRRRPWIFRARQPRASRGQVYSPPPQVQIIPVPQQQPVPVPVPQQQIIYVRERRPSFFRITCSVLSILLLMACGLIGVAVYRGVITGLQTFPANLTVKAFCLDESTQNYSGAYQQLSSSVQQDISTSDFENNNNSLDQLDGKITSCDLTSNSSDTVSDNGNLVTVEVTVDRANGSSISGFIYVMKQEGGGWSIESINPILDLGL